EGHAEIAQLQGEVAREARRHTHTRGDNAVEGERYLRLLRDPAHRQVAGDDEFVEALLLNALAFEGDLRIGRGLEHVGAIDEILATLGGLRLDGGRIDGDLDRRLERVLLVDVDGAAEGAKATFDVRDGVMQRGELDEAVDGVYGPGSAADLSGLSGAGHG